MEGVNHILIIDNEENWLNFAKETLFEHGYEVQISQSLKDGFKNVQNIEFQLVMVDLKKVEKDKDTFRKIADFQIQRKNVVVVMFPTELTPDKVSKIFTIGAHDCVDKPYEESKIVDLAKSHFPIQRCLRIKKQFEKKFFNILIVEDDEDWREKLSDYLKNAPYNLEITDEYSTAVKLIIEKQYDVIVLDLRLIDNSVNFEGMELLELLKKEDRDIPVIIVSAYGTIQHVKDGFKLYNVCDYLSKQHFDPCRYQKSVRKACNFD